MKKLLLTIAAVLALAGCGEEESSTTIVSEQNIFYASIDSLNVRANPNPDEAAFYQLALHEEVTFLGEMSTNQETYILREYQYTTNFFKVRLPDGREGWVFGAALTNEAEAELATIYDRKNLSGVIVGTEITDFGEISVNRYGEYVIEDVVLFYTIFTNAVLERDYDTLFKLSYGDMHDNRNPDSSTARYPNPGWEMRDDFNKPYLMNMDWNNVEKIIISYSDDPYFVSKLKDLSLEELEEGSWSGGICNQTFGRYEEQGWTLYFDNSEYNGWYIQMYLYELE